MKLDVVRAPGMRTPPRIVPVLTGLARRLSPSWLRVHLVLGNDTLLRQLNRDHRGIDHATDVLSFRYDATRPPSNVDVHAEVYVSLERARVQARSRRHSLSREVVLLALHGLLHLQGHDHERLAAARRMRAAEEPHLRWLARRCGWSLEPLVQLPQAASARVR